MKEMNPIDELFKNKLEGHAESPSANVWDKIEAGLEPKKKRVAPIFMLRAASVALLIGLSSVWYFNKHQDELTRIEVERGKDVVAKEGEKKTSKTQVDKPVSEQPKETEPKVKEEKKENLVPVMNTRPSKKQQIFVSNEAETVVEENKLEVAETIKEEPADANVNTKQSSLPKIKVKFKVNPTVTGYYANNEEDKQPETQKPLKEKVWAYASNQVGNIINGRKIDSPIKKGKPELEINLPEIFNN